MTFNIQHRHDISDELWDIIKQKFANNEGKRGRPPKCSLDIFKRSSLYYANGIAKESSSAILWTQEHCLCEIPKTCKKWLLGKPGRKIY